MLPTQPSAARSLQGPLLAAVSRSFYLSLRFLPQPVRAPLSVSYLLARAADTIADVEARPSAERLVLLEEFRAALADGVDTAFLERVAGFASAVDHAGERELLARLGECLGQRKKLPDPVRSLVDEVMHHILDGMMLDLRRFPDATRLRCLTSDADLEQYTWLVAGCVGEFWTSICASRLPGVFTKPDAEMRALGARYGKGLQLINILRDQAGDAEIGRCYLPEDLLREAGVAGALTWPAADWRPWHTVRTALRRRTREYLSAGWVYAASQRSVRLRFATLMPLLIGEGTLRRMEALPVDGPPQAVKISRTEVKAHARRALWMAVTGRIPAPPATQPNLEFPA